MCVNHGVYNLTLGKIYDANDDYVHEMFERNYYRIVNDIGVLEFYSTALFKHMTIQLIREDKLDKLI